MALACIGNLPDTIMDRSLVINMKRKLTSKIIVDIKPTMLKDNKVWRSMIARWCLDSRALVKPNLVKPKDTGNDRNTDNWVPLLTVASLISPEWKKKGEKAHSVLSTGDEPTDSIQLLIDILEHFNSHVFTRKNVSRISSQDLVSALNADKDKIWFQCNYGRPLTAPLLARMLKPYGIAPKATRITRGQPVKRGYEVSDFQETFASYLDGVTV